MNEREIIKFDEKELELRILRKSGNVLDKILSDSRASIIPIKRDRDLLKQIKSKNEIIGKQRREIEKLLNEIKSLKNALSYERRKSEDYLKYKRDNIEDEVKDKYKDIIKLIESKTLLCPVNNKEINFLECLEGIKEGFCKEYKDCLTQIELVSNICNISPSMYKLKREVLNRDIDDNNKLDRYFMRYKDID